MRASWLGLLMIGCGGGSLEPTDEGDGGGACGAVTEHTLDLIVTVVDDGGAPVTGASVTLEERSWEPGVIGAGTTDESGVATLSDLSITSVADCWGVVLDYRLVVTAGEASTESGLNPALLDAITTGDPTVERTVTLR